MVSIVNYYENRYETEIHSKKMKKMIANVDGGRYMYVLTSFFDRVQKISKMLFQYQNYLIVERRVVHVCLTRKEVVRASSDSFLPQISRSNISCWVS